MLTIKKSRRITGILLLVAVVLGGGCKPAGVRALYKGEKLIREGEFDRAVAELQEATRELPTNALAFNYLGLAYHRGGRPREAHEAYTQAIALDRELSVAYYNLGCLYLEQNNAVAAVTELSQFTRREPRSVQGLLKLGNAYLQTDDRAALGEAYKTFHAVLELEPGHPEAFNGLGLMELKRERPKDAVYYFDKALESNPTYGAVLLNKAVVAHEKLNDKPLALQTYRQYLALEPRRSNWEAVASAARNLELEMEEASGLSVALNPEGDTILTESVPSNPPATTTSTQTVAALPPELLPQTNAPGAMSVVDGAATGSAEAEVTPRIEREPPVEPKVEPQPAEPVTVKVQTPLPQPAREPLERTGPREPGPRTSKLTPVERPRGESGFRSRLQARSSPSSSKATDPVPVTPVAPPSERVVRPAPVAAREVERPRETLDNGRRYVYLTPPAAPRGDRARAERSFLEGLEAHKAGRYSEAVLKYRQATQLDAGYFEAYYNQGLAALEMRDWKQSLAAYEYALAQNPDSANARYNFALALQAGSYLIDSASELRKLIQAHPRDTRAYLSLANLYAGKLGRPDQARIYYRKVLEIDPGHPQAARIRGWLAGRW